jgi:DNA polymerase I-like protein with 3'-5' exonuclease and polymerase domains
MPVLAVLADMEEVGVGVNLRVLKHQQAPIHAKLKEIQTVVGHLTGAPVRAHASPHALGSISR